MAGSTTPSRAVGGSNTPPQLTAAQSQTVREALAAEGVSAGVTTAIIQNPQAGQQVYGEIQAQQQAPQPQAQPQATPQPIQENAPPVGGVSPRVLPILTQRFNQPSETVTEIPIPGIGRGIFQGAYLPQQRDVFTTQLPPGLGRLQAQETTAELNILQSEYPNSTITETTGPVRLGRRRASTTGTEFIITPNPTEASQNIPVRGTLAPRGGVPYNVNALIASNEAFSARVQNFLQSSAQGYENLRESLTATGFQQRNPVTRGAYIFAGGLAGELAGFQNITAGSFGRAANIQQNPASITGEALGIGAQSFLIGAGASSFESSAGIARFSPLARVGARAAYGGIFGVAQGGISGENPIESGSINAASFSIGGAVIDRLARYFSTRTVSFAFPRSSEPSFDLGRNPPIIAQGQGSITLAVEPGEEGINLANARLVEPEEQTSFGRSSDVILPRGETEIPSSGNQVLLQRTQQAEETASLQFTSQSAEAQFERYASSTRAATSLILLGLRLRARGARLTPETIVLRYPNEALGIRNPVGTYGAQEPISLLQVENIMTPISRPSLFSVELTQQIQTQSQIQEQLVIQSPIEPLALVQLQAQGRPIPLLQEPRRKRKPKRRRRRQTGYKEFFNPLNLEALTGLRV